MWGKKIVGSFICVIVEVVIVVALSKLSHFGWSMVFGVVILASSSLFSSLSAASSALVSALVSVVVVVVVAA